MKQKLSDSSIKRVAYFCDSVINCSRYVGEINTTFLKKGCELLKKEGYQAVVIVTLSYRSSDTMHYCFQFTIHEDFEYDEKFGIDNVDESCTVLYKIL